MGDTKQRVEYFTSWYKEVNKLREALGLPLIKKGKTSCLNCGRKFLSTDTKSNRVCLKCNLVNNYINKSSLFSPTGA